jgi:hypothetical protein
MDWLTLVRHPNLAAVDLVVADAAVSAGLPGMEGIDHEEHIRRVDRMAASCRNFIERVTPHFRQGRGDYPDSEGQFRVQAMVTHLQRDLGVRYHPERRSEDSVFRPEDTFLYGILFGQGGTCGSLPTLYAAVGRRLGYPIKLATTKGHLFCRWEGAERFNIEAAGRGVSFYPDEHYRTGRFEMPPQTISVCGYLQPLTPREEVAGMMCQRAECWTQERTYGEAVISYAWAHELDPRRMQHEFLFKQAIRSWDEALRNDIPPYFPRIEATIRERQFTQMPEAAELAIVRLRVAEQVLNDPDWKQRWWAPARRNPAERPKDFPNALKVDYRWNQPAAAGSST